MTRHVRVQGPFIRADVELAVDITELGYDLALERVVGRVCARMSKKIKRGAYRSKRESSRRQGWCSGRS